MQLLGSYGSLGEPDEDEGEGGADAAGGVQGEGLPDRVDIDLLVASRPASRAGLGPGPMETDDGDDGEAGTRQGAPSESDRGADSRGGGGGQALAGAVCSSCRHGQCRAPGACRMAGGSLLPPEVPPRGY